MTESNPIHLANQYPNSNSVENRLCQDRLSEIDTVWQELRNFAHKISSEEPILAPFLDDVILSQHTMAECLAARLARRLSRADCPRHIIQPIFSEIFTQHPETVSSAVKDLLAIHDRDPACQSPLEPLLFFKGFLALTTHRAAHQLWKNQRHWLALYLQSLTSEVYSVDIHPAARIGCGILLDHATSIVIGETAIIEDNVSILHEVTLGGTGKECGDRHPIIRTGVLIGAGSKILGRVEIGEGAKIGAGSVVLNAVPPHTTVAGVPAVIVGYAKESNPACQMNQQL